MSKTLAEEDLKQLAIKEILQPSSDSQSREWGRGFEILSATGSPNEKRTARPVDLSRLLEFVADTPDCLDAFTGRAKLFS